MCMRDDRCYHVTHIIRHDTKRVKRSGRHSNPRKGREQRKQHIALLHRRSSLNTCIMLQKLDPRKLHALSLEGDVHEEYDFDPFQHFDQIREQITTGTEESNWAWGVAGILRYAGDLCALPRRRRRMTSCEQYRKSDDWWIELLVRIIRLRHSKHNY